MNKCTPRIAIVQDWLTVYAGAERVLEQIINIWPEADLFSLIDFVPDAERAFLQGKKATTTFLQRLPWVKTKYRNYLPLMPMAIEQLDLSAYDIVISCSSAVAKGVLTGPAQLHVSYVHSPIRYAWDLQNQYLTEAGLATGLKGALSRAILHYIRIWDSRTANGVDHFISCSDFIARRILKTYRRNATIIHPPVDIERFQPHETKEDFYFTASRLVPYKRIPLIAEAFTKMPDKQLVIIGAGPEFNKVKRFSSSNVRVLGFQSAETLLQHMQRAKAFIFAAEEDFGIVPVEAQACGTPVIAYGKGGALETIIDGETGLFFYEQSIAAIQDAVRRFEVEAGRFQPELCRKNAERFSSEIFRTKMKQKVLEAWESFASSTISFGSSD
jgi:glycosyltransferase involved in cell wall biosynthesis